MKRSIRVIFIKFDLRLNFNRTFDRKSIANVEKFSMGGYGSGGYRWGLRRIPVENCVVLDIHRLTREDLFDRGEPLQLQFRSVVTTAVLYDRESSELLLTFQVLNGNPINQTITVTRAACHLGGTRYWLACPRCGKRAAKLYLPVDVSVRPNRKGFACRHCHGLGYAVRNTKNKFRLTRLRQTRVETRLRERDIPICDFPPKPKYMHWRTYQRYIADLTTARRKSNESLIQDFAQHFPETLAKCMRAEGGPDQKR